jgi:hypothetical protein
VTVPVRACALAAPAAGSRDAAPCLALTLRGAAAPLLLDKPAAAAGPLDRARAPGTGLLWGADGLRGVAPADGDGPHAPTAAVAAAHAAALPALKAYALLVRTLGGAPVADMRAARAGEWALETMHATLGAQQRAADAAADAAPRAAADLAYWRRAAAADGRVFWWHTLTWARQWHEPTVDGKGPYHWHPLSAHRDEPTPKAPAAQAAAV